MKIYELRSALSGDIGAILDEPGDEQEEQFRLLILGTSRLFTTLERAKAAADEEHDELYIEFADQDQLNSADLSNCPELMWEFAELTGYACDEDLGAYWMIKEHEIEG